MKYNLFKRVNGTNKMVTEQFVITEDNFEGMPMPHCDQKVLHSPTVCKFCDQYPEAQALRQWWYINYTGEHDPGKAPCPSTHLRTEAQVSHWPGNVAGGPYGD